MVVSGAQGRAVFAARDQGIGIPADQWHHLCDALHRASNVGAIAGSGLGLSVVKNSAELQDGTFTVRSTPGEAACFTAVL